jgi:hypothetical protein
MRKYYYIVGQDRVGPLTLLELKLVKGLTPGTLVWYDGLPAWVRAGEVSELSSVFASSSEPPPLPGAVPPPLSHAERSLHVDSDKKSSYTVGAIVLLSVILLSGLVYYLVVIAEGSSVEPDLTSSVIVNEPVGVPKFVDLLANEDTRSYSYWISSSEEIMALAHAGDVVTMEYQCYPYCWEAKHILRFRPVASLGYCYISGLGSALVFIISEGSLRYEDTYEDIDRWVWSASRREILVLKCGDRDYDKDKSYHIDGVYRVEGISDVDKWLSSMAVQSERYKSYRLSLSNHKHYEYLKSSLSTFNPSRWGRVVAGSSDLRYTYLLDRSMYDVTLHIYDSELIKNPVLPAHSSLTFSSEFYKDNESYKLSYERGRFLGYCHLSGLRDPEATFLIFSITNGSLTYEYPYGEYHHAWSSPVRELILLECKDLDVSDRRESVNTLTGFYRVANYGFLPAWLNSLPAWGMSYSEYRSSFAAWKSFIR